MENNMPEIIIGTCLAAIALGMIVYKLATLDDITEPEQDHKDHRNDFGVGS